MSYPRPTVYGTLYGWLMKLAHRFNWHHTRTIYPDGDTMVICDWCGIRDVIKRAERQQYHLSTGEQQVMRKALIRSASTRTLKEHMNNHARSLVAECGRGPSRTGPRDEGSIPSERAQ